MSHFKECAEAIRHRGFDETAKVVDQLAVKKPMLFAAVSRGETGYGEEVQGLNPHEPRIFLTRKSANLEGERLTCNLLRTKAANELLEQIEMQGRSLDPNHVSQELSRILGKQVVFPGPGVNYWDDPQYSRPLVPPETSDEKTLEIAKLLKLKLFKTISVPCDVHLKTPPISAKSTGGTRRGRDARESENRGVFSFLRRLTR